LTASPPEHVIASTASSSTPLDRFALDLNRFARNAPPPPAPEHAVDLDRFTNALDHALRQRPQPRASLDFVLPLPTGNPRGTCELLFDADSPLFWFIHSQIYDKVPT
jgi:hypothetical protein